MGNLAFFGFFGASSLPRAPELEFVSTCGFGRFYEKQEAPPKPTHAQILGPECVYLLCRSAQQEQIHNFSDPGGQNIFFFFLIAGSAQLLKKGPLNVFCGSFSASKAEKGDLKYFF